MAARYRAGTPRFDGCALSRWRFAPQKRKPGIGAGRIFWFAGLQAEARHLFLWLFASLAFQRGKHASDSNKSDQYVQIFHHQVSFPVRFCFSLVGVKQSVGLISRLAG
jgi:hypothetical protein